MGVAVNNKPASAVSAEFPGCWYVRARWPSPAQFFYLCLSFLHFLVFPVNPQTAQVLAIHIHHHSPCFHFDVFKCEPWVF